MGLTFLKHGYRIFDMKRFWVIFTCFIILSGATPAFSEIGSSVKRALEVLRRINSDNDSVVLSDFEWLEIKGCECDDKKGVCTDSSDELCNVQCCINKYGKAGAFEVNGVCCQREDDDCICQANGCKMGDKATPLDSYCCAKEKGII